MSRSRAKPRLMSAFSSASRRARRHRSPHYTPHRFKCESTEFSKRTKCRKARRCNLKTGCRFREAVLVRSLSLTDSFLLFFAHFLNIACGHSYPPSTMHTISKWSPSPSRSCLPRRISLKIAIQSRLPISSRRLGSSINPYPRNCTTNPSFSYSRIVQSHFPLPETLSRRFLDPRAQAI